MKKPVTNRVKSKRAAVIYVINYSKLACLAFRDIFLEGPEGDVLLPYPLGLKSLQILGMYQHLKTNVKTFLVFLGSKHKYRLSSA